LRRRVHALPGGDTVLLCVGASARNGAQLPLGVLAMVLGDRQRAELEAALAGVPWRPTW
jgi:hypothetical protein